MTDALTPLAQSEQRHRPATPELNEVSDVQVVAVQCNVNTSRTKD